MPETEINYEAEAQKARAAELKNIVDAVYENYDKNPGLYHLLTDFAQDFMKRYRNPGDYLLFHVISGSTPIEGREHIFDTPDHEIENFILSLEPEVRKLKPAK